MDRPRSPVNRPSSPVIRPSSEKSASTSVQSQPFNVRQGSRTVQGAPADRYFRHPTVLRIELNRRLGDRLINKLKLASETESIALQDSEHGHLDSAMALSNAKKLLSLLADDDSESEVIDKIKHYLAHPETSEEQALELKQLLHFLANQSPDDDLSHEGLTSLGQLIDEFGGRALSIFLQTRFGQFILEQYHASCPLKPEDESKMNLGLKLIQTRLQARSKSAPDAPLVEYASLYLGDDIDLEQHDHIQPIIELTLQSIEAKRLESEESDSQLQTELENILDEIEDTYPNKDRIEWVYYHLKMDPELRNFLDTEQLLSPDPTKLQTYLQSGRRGITELKKLVSAKVLEKNHGEDIRLLKALDGGTSGIPALLPDEQTCRWMLEYLNSNPEYKKLLDFQQLLSEDPSKLEAYLNSGRKEVKQLTSHLSRRLKRCKDDIKELDKISRTICTHWDESLSDDHLIALSQGLHKAKSHCTLDTERQTLTLLSEHLDYQILEHAKEHFVQELRQQLKYLEDSGSERTITVSVGLGASAAIPFVKGVSIDGALNYTFRIAKNDDGRTREFHVINPSLSAKLGDDKAISVTASGGVEVTKGRVFRSTEEAIRFHSNDFVPVLMSSLQKITKNAKGTIDSRRADKLHDKVTANRQLLAQRLAEMKVIHPSDQVSVRQVKPINYADFTQKGVRGQFTINALAGVLEASATIKNKCTNFRTRTNLRQMLYHNPDKAFPPKIEYLSFWTEASITEQAQYNILKDKIGKNGTNTVSKEPAELITKALQQFKEENGVVSKRQSGQRCIEWLNNQARNLSSQILLETSGRSTPDQSARAKTRRLEIRERIKKSLIDQFFELDMYYYNVNAMEGRIGEDTAQKYFHQTKHSMQETYKANDRGEYIAAHTYTFHHLIRMYEKTFLPGESPVVDDTIFAQVLQSYLEPSLDNPQLNLSNEKHIRKSLTASSVAQSTEKSISSELKVNIPHTGLTLKGDYTFTAIGQHVNPDNDGLYFNAGIELPTGATPATAIKALETALQKLKGKRVQDTTLPEISLAEFAPEVLGTSVKAGGRLEFNFVKRQRGWHLQYTRLSGKDSIGASVPDIGIPTGPLVETNIKAGASVSTTRNWYEQPGNNTLTYLQAKFNGWLTGNMIKTHSFHVDPSDKTEMTEMEKVNPFYAYCQTHKQAISQLLVHLAAPEKSAHDELFDMFCEISALCSRNYCDNFSEQLRQYARSPDPDSPKFNQMVQKLEQFLSIYHTRYLEIARKRYKTNIKKSRII